MGQSGNLYRLDATDFIERRKEAYSAFQMCKLNREFVSFFAFEGLAFVLAKGRTNEEVMLLQEIFYPLQCYNLFTYTEEPTNEAFKLEAISDPEDYFDYLENVIPFLPVEKVQALYFVLQNINDDQFTGNFDPVELNINNVYPEVWHDNNAPDYAYNRISTLREFIQLREFFKHAAKEGNFVLSFLG